MVAPGGWSTRINNHHDVEWIPPPHLDTGQTRTNNYHRPERLHPPPNDEPITHGDNDIRADGSEQEQPAEPPNGDEPGGPEPDAA
jgi:hypothetical protein